MKKHKKIIASIIVANFNNAKFLDECLRSIFSQTFKSYEIIVVDDNSKDNSIEILNKYKKKIFIIQNKKKTKYGSFNQINSYYKGFLRSKGTFIFFLDSDDYFKKDKLKSVIKTFQREKKQKLIFDLPILKYKNDCVKNTFKQKFFFISNWPRFSPQSCISVRKDYADELFTNLRIKKFDKIWFDFRIAAYTFLMCKKIFIYNKYLTYYRQHQSSESQKFKSLTKNWWIRRNQAHNFIRFLSKKKRLKNQFSIDGIITKIVNLFIHD